MDLQGKSFLVTGGAGFVGSQVVSELLKHDINRVVIFDNFSRGKTRNIDNLLKDDRVKVYQDGGDIRDIDILSKATENIHGVFHLAAMWLLHCKDYPRTAFNVNIQGTFNVLEVCIQRNIEKLVYSSSASVYGDAVTVPMKEDHPFNNRNFYGATKIAGEAMCRAFHDRYGLDYISLRYMNVYGAHQDENAAYTGVIPIMFKKIMEGQKPIINGDGSQAYDFIEVADVARANVLAMQSNNNDCNLNVGTGVQTTIRELCSKIRYILKTEIEEEYLPYSPEDSRRLVQNRIADVSLCEKTIGFKYSTKLEEGLTKLYRHYLQKQLQS